MASDLAWDSDCVSSCMYGVFVVVWFCGGGLTGGGTGGLVRCGTGGIVRCGAGGLVRGGTGGATG